MYKSKEDRNANQMSHYRRRRAWMISYLGGVCKDCGSTEDLELDHLDRSQKSFNISQMYSFSLELLTPELDKCCLRCKACHKKKTLEVDGLKAKHGTGGMYRHHGCRCELCKEANRKYQRDYAIRRKSKSISVIVDPDIGA